MKHSNCTLLLMAGLLLLGAQAFASPELVPIPGIVSTGAGLAQGATDASYLLISAPAGVTLNSSVVVCDVIGCGAGTTPAFPFWANSPWAWQADDASSAWLGVLDPSMGGLPGQQYGNINERTPGVPGTGVTTGDPQGWYDFRVEFTLSAYQAATAAITGAWAVDNVGQIYLNGSPTSFSCQASPSCYQTMTGFNLNSGFVAGVNYMDFKVYNWAGATGNPVGLRVDMSGYYEVPEPASATLWGVGLAALAILRLRRRAS
jgi:hypothetical protein